MGFTGSLNRKYLRMKNSSRLIVWIIVAVLILSLFVVMQFTDEVQWGEFIAYSIIFLLLGGTFELWQWLKARNSPYRIAFILGLAGLFFLSWVNGAVGIIGSEDYTANLLYIAVFATGLIGSLLVRFKPRGMAFTLLAMATVQVLIPFFALSVWPAKGSWGEVGVVGVIIANFIFALMFIVSAWLFWRASIINLETERK